MEDPTLAIEKLYPLLLGWVQALVDDPEAVTLEYEVSVSEVVYTLHVAERDLGKVIGKQGKTAAALRTLLAAAGMRQAQRYVLNLSREA